MSDTKTASWIAALERARAEIEGALSADPQWRAPRGSAGDVDWAWYEKTFGTNPLYRCWAQLNEAIVELRRQSQAEASAGRRRISLRDVLEHIRSDATLTEHPEPQAAAADASRIEAAQPPPSGLEPPAAQPGEAAHAPPEAEEATVSFVVREPARPAPVAGHRGEATAAKKSPPPKQREREPDPGAEAEVVIVPRRR